MYDPLKAKARVAIFTAAAFLGGLGIASGLGWTHASREAPTLTETPQVSANDVRPALDLSEAFVRVADVVTPAVVRIETRRPAQLASSARQQQEVPDFFRRFFPDMPDGGFPQQQGPELSGGSGFMVSAEGHILTNDHVVSGSDQVVVYLHDGRNFPARIIGTDPFTDVAIIKVDLAEPLPHLSLGDSEGVRVGEWVLAVGNPGFAGGAPLDYTVTAGIVSARGRGLQLLNRGLQQDPRTEALSNYAIEDFIQTDAAINPGNSGGPLVDLQGRVIGINSAIASASGFYQGYGFAIPVNLARRVMEDLVEYGHVKRAMMGVSIGPVAPEDAERYGLPSVAGALVNDVPADQPAARAGVRVQDVIVAVNGQPVAYPGQLQQRVAQFKPGDEVTVTVYRNRRPTELRVRLTEAPLNERAQVEAPRERVAEQRLGIQVEPLTQQNFQQYGFSQPGGVVISNVEPGSAANRRALGPGWKILSINDKEVTTAEQVREALQGVRGGDIVNMRVTHPEAGSRIVNVRMPQ
jgi:serine protease Do